MRMRMVYAALAGILATAAPLALYRLVDTQDDAMYALWLAAPVLGPMVFELICRRRPEWGWGLAFAVVLAVVFGVWSFIDSPIEELEGGLAVLFGVFIFVSTFLAGMVGASIASLIARAFDHSSERLGRSARRFHPWHVGAALVLVEIVAVTAVAAATA
jgi:uncharacterized membrane protein YeaQ/YmgE (transglycosylase-associated protein family)